MKDELHKPIAVIQFRPLPEEKKLGVTWKYRAFYKEVDGRMHCYIPAFSIHFAATPEVMKMKGRAMTRMYFDSFFKDTRNGLKALILELNKRGFVTTNHAYTVGEFLNKRPRRSKFSINATGELDFDRQEEISQELETELA